MIVPRPPLSLSKQQQSLSTYRRRYHCDGEDSFADCNYIRRFVAIQIDAANNASTKLIVVAARTSGSPITGSTVQALNEDFGHFKILRFIFNLLSLFYFKSAQLGL